MTKEHDEPEGICIGCLSEKIANRAVGAFTGLHPDVKMSFTQWLDLIEAIEDEIKDAFGADDDEEESADARTTVQ